MDMSLIIAGVFAVLGLAVALTIMSARSAAQKPAAGLPPSFRQIQPNAPKGTNSANDRKAAQKAAKIGKMMEKPFPETVEETKAKAMMGRYALQKIVEADPKIAAKVVSGWSKQGKAQK